MLKGKLRRTSLLLLQRKSAFAEATDYWRQLLEVSIRDALIDIFGEGTPQYRLYSPAATIDTVPISYAFKVPHNEIVKVWSPGKRGGSLCLAKLSNLYKESLPISEPTAARKLLFEHLLFQRTYLLSMATTNEQKLKWRS